MWAENGKNRNKMKMKVQFTVEINNNIVTYKINILLQKPFNPIPYCISIPAMLAKNILRID